MRREFAVYRGEVYAASDRPPGQMLLRREGVPDQLVPIADLDSWYSIRTFATFLDHDFEVLSERDGRYTLHFHGGDGKWAARVWAEPEAHPGVAFERHDMFTFIAVAPKDLVTGVREERTEHLTKETDES